MFEHLPPALQRQIKQLMANSNFRAAKLLYDDWKSAYHYPDNHQSK